jgi:putative phosphoesterase
MLRSPGVTPEATPTMATPQQTIGLISDTHGLLRPEAVEALRGSHHIVHAGDVGDPGILDELRRLAPVTVVRGNVDTERWAEDWPTWAHVGVGAVSIYVIHDLAAMDIDAAAAEYRAVVSGHSHQPGWRAHRGVLFINPGSAGPRRFKLPISVGRLEIDGASITPRLITLTPPSASEVA